MAVSENTDFNVTIKANDKASDEIEKIIAKLKSTIKSLPKNIDVSNIEKQLKDVRKTTNVASDEMKKLSESIDSVSASSSVMQGTNVKTIKNLQKTAKSANDASTGFAGFFERIKSASKSISSFIANITAIISVIRNLVDPENIKNIAKLAKLMSLFFKMKGNNNLAKGLSNVSNGLNEVTVKLEDAGEKLDEFSHRAHTLMGMFERVGQAVNLTGVSIIGFLTAKVGSRFGVWEKGLVKMGTSTEELGQKMSQASQTMKTKFNPGIVKTFEAAALAGPVLFLLGKAALESESSFIRLAGRLSIVAAVILASFTGAITFLISKIAELSIAVGSKILDAMTRFQKIFIKASDSVAAFEFTIKGFVKAVGEEGVGSLKMWNAQISNIANTTVFAGGAVRKSVSLLVKESQALGLTVEQNKMILKTATDIAAATGKDIEDVTLRIIQGLTGQSQGMLAVGINIRENALAHSNFAHEMNKSVSEMNEAEKQLVRYNSILEQAAPLAGAAAAQVETIAGSQRILEKTLDSVKSSLGQSTTFTEIYTVSLTKLAQSFLNLPNGIIKSVGNLLDFSGVILTVGGQLAKYALIIAFVSSAYGFLNFIILKSVKVQQILTIGLQFVSAKMGLTTIAVTSLSTAIKAFLLETINITIIMLKKLSLSLVATVKSMTAFTATMMANPLFRKVAAISIGIGILISVISTFSEEIKNITNNISTSTIVISTFIAVIGSLAAALKFSVAAQALFSASIVRLGFLVGAQTTSVVSLAALLSNLKNIFTTLQVSVGIMSARVLPGLIVSLSAAKAAVISFTVAVLSNPIFLGIAAVATAIGFIISAVNDLTNNVKFLSNSLEDSEDKINGVKNELGLLARILNTTKQAFYLVGSTISNSIEISLIGFMATALAAQKTWIKFKMSFAKNEELKSLEKDLAKVEGRFEDLKFAVKSSVGEMIHAFAAIGESSAIAGEIDNASHSAKKSKEEFKKLRKELELIDKESIVGSIIGNQFDIASNRAAEARTKFNVFFDALLNGTEKTKENIEKLHSAFKEMTAAGAEFAKLRSETFKNLEQQTRNLNVEVLRGIGKEIEAANIVAKQRLLEFDKKAANIRKAFDLSAAEEKNLADLRISIIAKSENEILKIKKQREKKSIKAAEDAAKKLKNINSSQIQFVKNLSNENLNLEINRLKSNKEFVAAQELDNQRVLNIFDQKISKYVEEQKVLNDNFKLREQELEIINKTRKALEGKNEAALLKAAKEQEEAIPQQGPLGRESIDLIETAFSSGAADIASAASNLISPINAMMGVANAVVGAVQGLIDFIPNILNAIANIFNSLTDLPLAIANAFDNVLNSILNYLENMGPNIFKAIKQILMSIGDFLFTGMENAVDGFIDKLDDAILGLIDNLPEIITKITVGLMKLFTIVPMKLIIGIMKMIPTLVKALIETIPVFAHEFGVAFTDLLKQIVNELAAALNLSEVFHINSDEIVEDLKTVGDEIARSSSQLFEVTDLQAASRGLDAADRIRNALESGSNKGATYFQRLFRKIKTFGKDLWEGFKSAWYDGTSAIRKLGMDIFDGFVDAVTNGVKAIEKIGSDIWHSFLKPIGDAFALFGQQIWKGLIVPAGEGLYYYGKLIWEGFLVPIGNFFADAGKQIWDMFADLFKLPEMKTPTWLENFIKAVEKLTGFKAPTAKGILDKIGLQDGGLVQNVQNQARAASNVIYLERGGRVPMGETNNGTLYANNGAFAQGTDIVDAKLTPGEFVVNREATRNNLGLLSFINNNRDPIQSGNQTSNFNITINAKTMLTPDQIRREIIPEMEKQLKVKSQAGRFVISQSGIRA